MSELNKLVGSGRGATSTTVPVELRVGEGVDADPGPQARRDPVDHRLVDLGVDLHLADVGQAEDLLPLADGRPFLDLGLVAADRLLGSLA